MDLYKFLIAALRRISYKWPPRSESKKAARESRNSYRCAMCNELWGNKDVQIDHIEPVVDPDVGFVDWNTYIKRLFCPIENFQVVCKICHSAKCKEENERRRERTKRENE